MIEPDRAGMTHRGLQHLTERLERALLEAGGVETRQAPILSGGVERIWRRADAEGTRDRGLLVPGIETVGLNADGDVEVETDLHAELSGERGACAQLAVGIPLHVFDELDFRRVRALAQARAFAVVGLLPLLGPFPPRLVE